MIFALDWLIILLVSQTILFLLSTLYLLPKEFRRQSFEKIIHNIYFLRKPIILILVVVIAHLIEVNVFDPITTSWCQTDFTILVQSIEHDIVSSFSNIWIPSILLFFVFIYIILYPFTLWYTPLYSIITRQKRMLYTLAYSLLFLYIFALPFYLFFPVTNVYTHYTLPSALNSALPEIETFFYSTTTQNNCFPSLHTAMSIIIARTIYLSNNKRFINFGLFVMVTVIISVVYLSIHWILDVIGGIVFSLLSLYLASKTLSWTKNHDSV